MSFLMLASHQQFPLPQANGGCAFMMTVATAPADGTKAIAANAMSFFFSDFSRAHGMRALVTDDRVGG
jgi:hypothetical protein